MMENGHFRRVIVIGDVHGCRAELDDLLSRLQLGDGDRLVFLGDLIDRGPESVEAVRLARDACVRCPGSTLIVGNHEQNLFRRLKDGPIRSLPGRPWAADLEEADLGFLRTAVLFDRDRERQLIFVHGGLYPRYFEIYGRLPADAALISQLDKKHRERLSRLTMIRYVDTKGEMVAFGQETSESRLWAEVYDGREGLACFGHAPALGPPRIFAHAIGLDTGCAFGGALTAAVFRGGRESYEFVSVPARRKYADLLDEETGVDGIDAE